MSRMTPGKPCKFDDEKICMVLNDCLLSCPLNTNRICGKGKADDHEMSGMKIDIA